MSELFSRDVRASALAAGPLKLFPAAGKNALFINFYVKLVSHKIEYDQSAWRLYEKVSSFDFFFDTDSMFNGY